MSEQRADTDTPRVVVGVDGSDESRAALRWAVDEARIRHAVLEVVYCWHHPYMTGTALYGDWTTDDLEVGSKALLEKILADEGLSATSDPPVTAILAQGAAPLLLVEAATGADLLVMGSRGRGAFAGMLLGSVSQHCVNHAPCPVVVVR